MTRIERHQMRIHCIKETLYDTTIVENNAIAPEAHHKIRKLENEYDHIGTFLHNNAGDPAVKVRMTFYHHHHPAHYAF